MKAKEFLESYSINDFDVFGKHEEHYSLDDLLNEYARNQIEKDRVSESELMVQVNIDSKSYDQSDRTCFLEGAETVLRQLRYRPINLD